MSQPALQNIYVCCFVFKKQNNIFRQQWNDVSLESICSLCKVHWYKTSHLVQTVTRVLQSGRLFVRDWPPPANVVMETLFWGSLIMVTHSIALSLCLSLSQILFLCLAHFSACTHVCTCARTHTHLQKGQQQHKDVNATLTGRV